MMTDADSGNEILVRGEDLWNWCKNLRRRLIFWKAFVGEWTVESARLASCLVPLYYVAGNMRVGSERGG